MRDGFLDGDEQFQARIAWLYYSQEMTQADIAQHLGINRSRVNQVLRIARNNGLVQVIIHSRLASCVALERRLEQDYGLRRCVIVPTPDREERLFAALGGAAGLHVSQNGSSTLDVEMLWNE